MNRLQLFAEVLADCNREDKADRLPGWLASAEFRINNKLRDQRMVQRAVLEITEMVFPVPPDLIAPKSMSIRVASVTPGSPGDIVGGALYIAADMLDNGLADPAVYEPRGPRFFTMRGRSIELGNWNLAGEYQVDLWYYANLPVLDSDTSTNWLLTVAPHIYKDAMLHFAFLHLQEFDTSDRCLVRMSAELDFLNEQNKELLQGSGPLIQRPTPGFGGSTRRRRLR